MYLINQRIFFFFEGYFFKNVNIVVFFNYVGIDLQEDGIIIIVDVFVFVEYIGSFIVVFFYGDDFLCVQIYFFFFVEDFDDQGSVYM